MAASNQQHDQRPSSAAGSSSGEWAIELKGINKHFGAVHANRDIDLKVKRGTIHGIVGENGAGKSTLMSILYGFYTADSGEIFVNGQQVKITDSRHALALGIGMVHQHFMLVDNFTVLENVVLGAEDSPLLGGTLSRARKELDRLEREYGLEVDPDATIENISVGQQQRVEILKALYRGAETLILDEPTGVLTPNEADDLFRILDVLRSQGKTIILITHKLREIMAATDTVSVAAMISRSLCVIRMMVLPCERSTSRMRNRSSASFGVSTPVGSSRIRVSAPRYSALRISTRCCWPTERFSTMASGSTSSP